MAKVFADMPDEYFIDRARDHCRCSLRNTGVGAWLHEALNRLERKAMEASE